MPWPNCFPGSRSKSIITDLLHAGLDEIAAAMPYERGPKVISRDDQGDPLYEDIGLTPRFVELTRKFKKNLAGGSEEISALDAARSARRYSRHVDRDASCARLGGGALRSQGVGAGRSSFNLVRRYPEPISASKSVVGFLLSVRFAKLNA